MGHPRLVPFFFVSAHQAFFTNLQRSVCFQVDRFGFTPQQTDYNLHCWGNKAQWKLDTFFLIQRSGVCDDDCAYHY